MLKLNVIEIKMTQYLLSVKILGMGSTPKSSPFKGVKGEEEAGGYRAKRGSG